MSNNASAQGRRINPSKTALMCVSAATSYKPIVHVKVGDVMIKGATSLKVLGLTLDSNFTFKSHVENLRNKMRRKTWALLKMKKAGLCQRDLIQSYKTLIRPVVEYVVPVWHPLITAEQASELERQQTQALRNIFGPGMSAKRMRETADIDSQSSRREKMCLKFANKCLNNKRCVGWFTERPPSMYARRLNTKYPRFHVPLARTDRYRNSPKNYLRGLLNRQ